VSSSRMHLESASQVPPSGFSHDESSWYAVHTLARHEKRVAVQFEEKCVCTFLPLLLQAHSWSERRSVVGIPMFSCYAFVGMIQTVEERLKVLRTLEEMLSRWVSFTIRASNGSFRVPHAQNTGEY
jgi:hypothetical protein